MFKHFRPVSPCSLDPLQSTVFLILQDDVAPLHSVLITDTEASLKLKHNCNTIMLL